MLVGSALALKIGNPLLGIPVAIISHYLLDATPHAEYSIKNLLLLRTKNHKKAATVAIKISCDIASGALLILFAAYHAHQSFLYAFTGGFAGILPDFMTFLFILFPRNRLLAKHNAFHQKIHFPKGKHASPVFRYGLQATAIILSIFAISKI